MKKNTNIEAMKATLALVLCMLLAVAGLYKTNNQVAAFAAEIVAGDPIPETEATTPETEPQTEPTRPYVPVVDPQPDVPVDETPIEETTPEETIHSHRKQVTNVAASCTTDGYKQVICVDCGEELEYIVVPAHGHTWNGWHVVKAATYTEAGEEQHECVHCGAVETRPIAKLVQPEPEVTEPAPTEPAPEAPEAPVEEDSPAEEETPVEGEEFCDDYIF